MTSEQPVNVLIIMTDQQRWDALSCAGNSLLETPNIDRLADQGTFFEQAYTASPICAPARASILTGCDPYHTGISGNRPYDVAADHPSRTLTTFDQILANNGYHTEFYGKWHSPEFWATSYHNWPISMAGNDLNRHFRSYLDTHVPKRRPGPSERVDNLSRRPYIPAPADERLFVPETEWRKDAQGRPRAKTGGSIGKLMIPAEHSVTAFHAKEAMSALDRLVDRQPFSMTCSFCPPHPPRLAPEPYFSTYSPADIPLWENFGDAMDTSPYGGRPGEPYEDAYLDGDMLREIIAIYYGLVAEIDHWVGCILDKLDAIGAADNTLVIFTSDHGDMLGSHGLAGKGCFYDEVAHIPLIIRLPGIIPAGMRVAAPASHLSLFPTILDYTGVEANNNQCHADSFRSLIDGEAPSEKSFAISMWDTNRVPSFMVRSDDWKLMFGRDENWPSIDALYNLKEDPNEMLNLLSSALRDDEATAQADELKALLLDWLEEVGSLHLEGVRARQV